MLDQNFGKTIAIILIAIIAIFALMIYSNNQSHQNFLEQEIQTLKNQVSNQDSTIEENKNQLLIKSQRQAAEQLEVEKQLLDKQAEIDRIQLENQQQLNQLKEKELDKKLDRIQSVVNDLEQQQEQEKELRKQYNKMSKGALKAAYLAQGLQTATVLKMHVAEYYMSEGQFPKNNEQLGLPRAKSYATDVIRSIWVSGGKITVVYKQVTDQDKGAISLIPKFKNNQIHWQCVTRDFKNIQQFMPQCKYSMVQ